MVTIILINNNWEQVKDLSDIVCIVEENIGYEFAREVERICGEPSADLELEIIQLESKIEDMKTQTNDYNDMSASLNYLDEQLDKLEEYIDDNDDGTDFMEGMRKAYKMIER